MKTHAAIAALLLSTAYSPAQRLSPLAGAPDWARLDPFQHTITRAEFERLLDTVYAPSGAWKGVITTSDTGAEITRAFAQPEKYTLHFAKDAASARPAPRSWRLPAELPPAPREKPLAGLRVALDPGHIGGEWAAMEERSFARPGDTPVREGDIALAVAQRAAAQARELGAEITLLRERAAPLSRFTVDALREPARRELAVLAPGEVRENYDGPRDPLRRDTVQYHAERLFYRVAEIRERARIAARDPLPDLVVCIHLNADDWADPEAPVFTPRDDLHVLIHGAHSAAELHYDDQRLEMLIKLLSRTHAAEFSAGLAAADAIRRATGLPPFTYTGGQAVPAGASDYLWARNLLATRLFAAPVIFLEPYRMNHERTYAWLQLGDYEGTRDIAGTQRPSLVREYAAAIVGALKTYRASVR